MSADEDQVSIAGDELTAAGDQAADAAEMTGADEVAGAGEAAGADDVAGAAEVTAGAAEATAGADEVTPGAAEVTAGAGNVSLHRRIALRAGRVPAAWRITIVVVLTLLVAASGVAAGIMDTQTSNDTATQQERDAAEAAAKTEVPQILSYNYKTLSADLARASADTTGQFSGQFGVLAGQLIGPNATKQQTVTNATVPVAAAVDSSGNEVTVLVFVDQSTTSKQQPKAQKNASQLRVTMQKVKGRWLIEQFSAL
jgi:Mce-associated membrane protein